MFRRAAASFGLSPGALSTRGLMSVAGSATGVLVITTGGMILVRMISSVCLTRLLSPDAFGLVGIINSIFFTAALLTDLGFQAYVVRHPAGEEDHFKNVIWTIHAGRGALLALVAAAGAPIFARVMAKPELTWPLIVAAVTLLVNGCASLSLITVLRAGGAKKLTLLEFYLTVFQSVLSIVLAVLLRSVWAIIWSMIAQSVLRTILSYALFSRRRHRFAADRALRSDFFRFSRVVLASSLLTLCLSQVDKLVLARAFTLREFGLYALAVNLVAAPAAFVNGYITRVIYPIYVQTWHHRRDELRQVYYAARQRVSRLYALGSGALVGAAPVVVGVLYDTRYAAASTYVMLLGISSALKLPAFAAAELMTAVGNIRMTFRANVVRLVWLATAGAGAYFALGSIGLVAAVGFMEFPVLIFSWIVLKRWHVLNMREEVIQLGMTGGGAIVGGVLSFGYVLIRHA